MRGFFQRSDLSGSRWKIGIDEDGDNAGTRQQIAQQAETFWFQFVGQQREACRISAWAAEAIDQACLDRVASHSKDDWDG